MGSLFENLKKYFENTPPEILEKDWKEIEYLNEIGPNVIEYEEYLGTVSYSSDERKIESHSFNFSKIANDGSIALDSQYYYAA